MTALKPRPYQQEAIDATFDAWGRGLKRPAVVVPTGGGKTVIFSHVAARGHAEHGGRTLILAHRDELLHQAAAELRAVAPDLGVGIVKADVNEVDRDVVIGSVQTLRSPHRLAQLRDIRRVIVDECHHAAAKSYTDILDTLDLPTLGVTATMIRGDRKALGKVWQEIVFQRDILWMIRKGYLCDVRGKAVTVKDFDLSGIRKSAGDFSESDLGEELLRTMAPDVVVQKYTEECPDRQGIVFTPTVETAEVFAETFRAAGYTAAAVYGAMPLEGRRRTLDAYQRGSIQVLTNCMVLTEGFNAPQTGTVVIARPTMNPGLYIQMAGRGLRIHPGKTDCLILDVVGAATRHRLATVATLAGEKIKKPADGESLMEAIEREQNEPEPAEAEEHYAGPVEVQEIDLFHGSRQAWKRTRAGFWYVATGERYIVLSPGADASSYDVSWWSSKRKGGGWLQQSVPDLGYAMAWAEAEIQPGEEVVASKGRAWHKKAATEKQLQMARRLGVDVPEGARAKAVSDLIDDVMASRHLDRPLITYLESQGRTRPEVGS